MKENLIAIIVGITIVSSAIIYVGDFNLQSKAEIDQNNQKINEDIMNYEITLKTNKGDITFETFEDLAPNTVDNFISLSEDGFYDGLTFHRVIEGFMIQGGCPEGTGRGGPGYTFDDEIDPGAEVYQGGYDKGVVAMANSGPNTNGSQFFIMVEDYPLPPKYTIFGQVTDGQGIADKISKVDTDRMDNPLEDIEIESVTINKK